MKIPNICKFLGQPGSSMAYSKAASSSLPRHSRNISLTGWTHTAGVKGQTEDRKIHKLRMPGHQFNHGKWMHIGIMQPDTASAPEIQPNIYKIPSQTYSAQPPCPKYTISNLPYHLCLWKLPIPTASPASEHKILSQSLQLFSVTAKSYARL